MKNFLKIKPIYIVMALVLLTILSYYFLFNSVDNTMQDSLLQQTKFNTTHDNRISIIGIDDESLAALGRWQDWKRNYYADIINVLSKGKPAVIGIDLIFSEKGENKEYDKALVDAVKNANNVVLPIVCDFGNRLVKDIRKSDRKVLSILKPFPELDQVSVKGHINVFTNRDDNVVRSFPNVINYQDQKIYGFDYQIYQEYLKNMGEKADLVKVPEDSDGSTYIDYVERPKKGIEIEKAPFVKVLNGEIDPEYFRDRIVLIGPYADAVADDSYLTPMDRQVKMYGIEIHANIIRNFLHQNFKSYARDWVNIILIILFAAIAYVLFRFWGPFKSAITILVVIIAYIFIAQFIYSKGTILSLFYPIFAIVVVYLSVLAFRYIQELLERKRITNVFGRYVAPQVVKEILKNGEEGLKLGGTRREITALFVDIRGFTPMSEKCQPEEVVEILNDYLNLTASSIFTYNGTLDKFIGDATMAIFNAPLDMEDHAFKAVQSAWAMREGSEVLRAKLEEKFGRSVQFGIGINTGYAVVGNIGSKARMDYTAIGDTVNTAARLESNSKPGQILLSESTYERVKDRIQATSLGEIKVKGKEQGVPIYQLDGIKE